MKSFVAAAILLFTSAYTPQEDQYGLYHSVWTDYVKTQGIHTFVDDRKCLRTSKTFIVGFGNATLEQDTCFFPVDRFDLATALSLFYSFWVDSDFCSTRETQQKLLEDLRSLEIEFSSRTLIATSLYDVNGKYIAESRLHGLTLGKGERIWISTRGEAYIKIHKTSFIHELVHVALCTENGYLHCDPDHTGARYAGWTRKHTNFIEQMNLYFKLIDL